MWWLNEVWYRVGFLHWQSEEAVSLCLSLKTVASKNLQAYHSKKKKHCSTMVIMVNHGWPWLTMLPWLKFCWMMLVLSRWIQQSLHRLQPTSPSQGRWMDCCSFEAFFYCCWRCCMAPTGCVVNYLNHLAYGNKLGFIHEQCRETLIFQLQSRGSTLWKRKLADGEL